MNPIAIDTAPIDALSALSGKKYHAQIAIKTPIAVPAHNLPYVNNGFNYFDFFYINSRAIDSTIKPIDATLIDKVEILA